MMGPHPAVAEVRRAVRQALAQVDGTVLVACSGGADSLALAAATAFEAPRAGVAAGMITVDHQLQSTSAAQAARVASIGYELGFDPVETVAVTVGTRGGPEAAARASRYAALQATAVAHEAHVLLGHTLDDQAETVLLGLGRGSGPRSISGMRAADGHWLRPFLGLRRSVTQAACAALGLQPWEDPHNADPSYQRVRLRREVLPLLEEVLQGGVVPALGRTAELLRDDLDALEELVGAAAPSPPRALPAGQRALSIDVAELAAAPRAVRSRMLRAWAHVNGAEPLSAAHTAALDALVTNWHGQGPLDLPGGLRAIRASGRLELTPIHQRAPGVVE
ncbi:MAG: tRNA lysidine(34) synthetase TilS [Actinomycetota bacterium]|nr:tRNA lysidine(34) synthetase TilS [Actinomycetota bacterium]